jgi:hypothetical protein
MVLAVDKDQQSGEEGWGTFHVRRNVKIASYNASPEPARKGSRIIISGAVRRLWVNMSDPDEAKYIPYVDHRVDVYFRPWHTNTYKRVRSATTTNSGQFSAAVAATVDGCWKVYSSQTTKHRGRWSKTDCIKVL